MRKLVMTVLTLALILGSISVASAAKGDPELTDIAGNNNQEAIQVTYDLKIVTGTPEGAYEPEKAVTRAEFAALITRALNIPESALSSYSTTTFKDTTGYSWAVPYLAILQQRGIMKGDGYGNAMPGRTINPNEAVTMVLRAIGYTDNASVLVGQWPANYVGLGQTLNLYAKVASDLEMNKASAAQMVYNVLTKQLVQVDANSTVKYLFDTSANLLNGDEQSLLTQNLNCLRLGNHIVSYADSNISKIDILPYVGAYGTLFISKADGEVVAVADVYTEFLAGKFTYVAGPTQGTNELLGLVDKFSSLNGTTYSLSPEAKDIVYRITGHPDYRNIKGSDYVWDSFQNGNDGTGVAGYVSRYAGYTSESAIQAYKTSTIDADNPTGKNPPGNASKLIIAAKVSGVTITELRSVAVWDAEIPQFSDHFLYVAGQIEDKKFNGHDFPVDVNNERDDYGYVLVGVDSLEDIAADNVVYIYKNSDKKIARIEVGTETQSGAITNINTGDALRTIGGKVLSDAPYHNQATWNDLEYINNEGTALLDFYGRTYAFRLGEASKGNFAVYVADQPSFSALQAKLFDKTGKEVVYSVKDQIMYNQTANTSVLTGTPAASALTAAYQQLVEYKLSGGSISELRVGQNAATYTGGIYGHVNKAGTIITVGIGGNVSKEYLLDSNTAVYVDDGKQNYSLGSVKDLLDKDIKKPFRYIEGTTLDSTKATVPDGKIRALVVNSDDAGAQNVFVMINGTQIGSDGAGGRIDVIKGLDFADGYRAVNKTFNYISDTLMSDIATNSGATHADPMIVKFRIGEDGVLRGAVDLDSNELYKDANNVVTNPTITNAALSAKPFWGAGAGGTFTLVTNKGTFAFNANAVLYKKVGASWEAMRADADTNFNLDTNAGGALNGLYTFLKTDPKSDGYDVIIKTDTYR